MATAVSSMSAEGITKILREKHKDDVFVAECKTGPSIGRELLIMDGWAMPKSWSDDTIVAYEIKISRNDFIRDKKWHRYLPFCNQFYFVCPPSVIQPKELPKEAGLLWVTTTGTRLLTKKVAPRRSPKIPDSVFRYVLMNRAGDPRAPKQSFTRDYWRAWLARREEDRDFGQLTGQRIRELIDKRIDAVRHENSELRRVNADLQEVADFLRGVGIEVTDAHGRHHYRLLHRAREWAATLDAVFPEDAWVELRRLAAAADNTHKSAMSTLGRLENIRQAAADAASNKSSQKSL